MPSVYVGMSVQERGRSLPYCMRNGLTISYDSILEISAQPREAVVAQVEHGVVCPPVLRRQLFTTSALDNIDHDPTTTIAKISFHGTSESFFQHSRPQHSGVERLPLKVRADAVVKKVPELLEAYTNVRPAYLHSGKETSNCTVNTVRSLSLHFRGKMFYVLNVICVLKCDFCLIKLNCHVTMSIVRLLKLIQ